jgi:hypothetical protein
MIEELNTVINNPKATPEMVTKAKELLAATAPKTDSVKLSGSFKYFSGVVKEGEPDREQFTVTISRAYAAELRNKFGSLSPAAAWDAYLEWILSRIDCCGSESDEKRLQEVRRKFPEAN